MMLIRNLIICVILCGFISCSISRQIPECPDKIQYLDKNLRNFGKKNAVFSYETNCFLGYDVAPFSLGGKRFFVIGDSYTEEGITSMNGEYTKLIQSTSQNVVFDNGRIKRMITCFENGEMEFFDLSKAYGDNPTASFYYINYKLKTMSYYSISYNDSLGEKKWFRYPDWMVPSKEVEIYGEIKTFSFEFPYWDEVEHHLQYLNSIREN